MNTIITVIYVFLVLAFTLGGLAQIFVPHTKYMEFPFQGWANDFEPWHVQLIGFLKVCAGIGLVVPLFMPSLWMLAPLAAVGLALVMAGAIATHLRRMEYWIIGGNLVYLSFALVVAYDKLVGFVA